MQKLARILELIGYNDPSKPCWAGIDQQAAYNTRETLIFEALAQAKGLGLPAGVKMDPKDPEWPIAFIELPTGQVSWHMEQHRLQWDGHSTEEKYRRINLFSISVRSKSKR